MLGLVRAVVPRDTVPDEAWSGNAWLMMSVMAQDPDRNGESAIVIVVPVPSVVRRLRLTRDPVARLGVPAHVTLLYPFVRPAELSPSLRVELLEIVAGHPTFDVAFARTERFPDVVWLAPEPDAPFRALTNALAVRYPDYPPYGSAFDDVIPHLTVAHAGPGMVDAAEVERAVAPVLPIAARVRHVWVLARAPGRRWSRRWRLSLGRPTASG